MIPAIISASTGRNVADDMVLYDVVSSLIKNTEARDACLIMVMNSLPSAGSIFLIACGRIISVSYTHLDVYKRQARNGFC